MFRLAKNLVNTLNTTLVSESADANIDQYFAHMPQHQCGLRILHNESNNNLDPWFDYVIGINGHELPTTVNSYGYAALDLQAFVNEINSCIMTCHVNFTVWSAKGGFVRQVTIPLEPGSEDVPLSNDTTLMCAKMGFSMQWAPLISATYVYHVMNVQPNSIAHHAQLVPQQDYIIGVGEGLLATGGEHLLGEVIKAKAGQTTSLFVYNAEKDNVRAIDVNVGLDGSMGCSIGYGLLHRLPLQNQISSLDTSLQSPEEYQQPEFDAANAITPANFIQQPVISEQQQQPGSLYQPPPIHRHKKKASRFDANILDSLQDEKERSPALSDLGSIAPPPKFNK